jgi:hypothetical protein
MAEGQDRKAHPKNASGQCIREMRQGNATQKCIRKMHQESASRKRIMQTHQENASVHEQSLLKRCHCEVVTSTGQQPRIIHKERIMHVADNGDSQSQQQSAILGTKEATGKESSDV